MCHNSAIMEKNNDEQQIERYMACGMPSKAVRSVKYTLKKREKQQQQKEQRQQQRSQLLEDLELSSSSSNSSDASTAGSGTDSEDSGADVAPLTLKTLSDVTTFKDQKQSSAAAAPEPAVQRPSSFGTNINSELLKFCPHYRKMQQQKQQQEQLMKEQQKEQPKEEAESSEVTVTELSAAALKAQQQRKLSSMEPSMDDALAIGTQMTRQVSERITCLVAQLQASRLYT